MPKVKTVVKQSSKQPSESNFIDDGLNWLSETLFDGPPKKQAKPEENEVDDAGENDEDEKPAKKPADGEPGGHRRAASGPGGNSSAPVNINISGLFREQPKQPKRKSASPPAAKGEAAGDEEQDDEGGDE